MLCSQTPSLRTLTWHWYLSILSISFCLGTFAKIKEFLACLFNSENFNLIINRILFRKNYKDIGISGLSFRSESFTLTLNWISLRKMAIQTLRLKFPSIPVNKCRYKPRCSNWIISSVRREELGVVVPVVRRVGCGIKKLRSYDSNKWYKK